MSRLRNDGTPYRARKSWAPILAVAKAYVEGLAYSPTLREVHYRLLTDAAHLGYENVLKDYSRLSELTLEPWTDLVIDLGLRF